MRERPLHGYGGPILKTLLVIALLLPLSVVSYRFLVSTTAADPASVEIIEIDAGDSLLYMTDPAYPIDSEYVAWTETLREVVSTAAAGKRSLLIWGGDNLALDHAFDWSIRSQMAKLEDAMDMASDEALFVTGNHDINQSRAVVFPGWHAVQRFGGDASRVVLGENLAVFLYDTYVVTDGVFDYARFSVHPDQARAYLSTATEVCATRHCLAVTGSHFVDRPSLSAHWEKMVAAGLDAVITGDSHESRYRPITFGGETPLPVLELSPSYGAKLPGALDMSGRPSAIFTIDADARGVTLEKVSLDGARDRTLLPDGLCEGETRQVGAVLSIDFLLDGLPCTVSRTIGRDDPLPTVEARIGTDQDLVAFDLTFDAMEGLSIPEADLARGVTVYASSKMDRATRTHGVTIIREGESVVFHEHDRWLRDRGKTTLAVGQDASGCGLSLVREDERAVAFKGCGFVHRVEMPISTGFFFGVRKVDDARGIATRIIPKDGDDPE